MRTHTFPLHPAAAWLKASVAPTAHLSCDSRTLRAGDVFMAYRGAKFDARNYIPHAVALPAGAVLFDDAGYTWDSCWDVPHHVPHYAQPDLKAACGHIAADWYGRPSAQLWSVGITGTSGKSSSALWLAEAFSALGKHCAFVGTLGIGFIDDLVETGLTTPDPVQLQRSLRGLVDQGAQALAMEVSSVGLVEGRVNGMSFDVALFTNLSRDHLDYHGDMAAYEAAKAQLFNWQGLRKAVVNLDDAAGGRMAAIARKQGAQVIGFSSAGSSDADLHASDLVYDANGMRFTLHGTAHGADFVRTFETPLIGSYNVANLLGVLGVLLASDVNIDDALRALRQLHPAPGRLERVCGNIHGREQQPMVLVDYAHKPDALEKALAACRPLAHARGGQLIVVFGCGGDRDAGKRPIMGAIAAAGADRVVITSDNPRSEDPQAIIAAIVAGVTTNKLNTSKLDVEVDRARAIASALQTASTNDVVLIAGKGHETYQEVAGVKQPFSDMAVARAVLSALQGAQA